MSTTPVNTPTERFVDAVRLAIEFHRDQARKHTEVSYVSHLLGVASLVMEHGGDEDQSIAAMLHDAVEDAGDESPGSGAAVESRIRLTFGDRVADIVRACSDTDQHPKPPWLQRKLAYLDHLAHVSDDVLLVSLADKVHNARAMATDHAVIGDTLFDRFNASKWQSHWYYGALYGTYVSRWPAHPLVGELRCAITRVWGRVVRLVEGDITSVRTEAIVNAANRDLEGGSGVCGAVFARAGWEEMQRACREFGGCPPGEARTTPGFGLPAEWVIHAVGPVWTGGGSGEAETLASAYRSALAEADRVGARSVAFPLLSSGIYGYPAGEACRIAVETLRSTPAQVDDVVIVAFESERAALVRDLLTAP